MALYRQLYRQQMSVDENGSKYSTTISQRPAVTTPVHHGNPVGALTVANSLHQLCTMDCTTFVFDDGDYLQDISAPTCEISGTRARKVHRLLSNAGHGQAKSFDVAIRDASEIWQPSPDRD